VPNHLTFLVVVYHSRRLILFIIYFILECKRGEIHRPNYLSQNEN
jgi:hypothetical protein